MIHAVARTPAKYLLPSVWPPYICFLLFLFCSSTFLQVYSGTFLSIVKNRYYPLATSYADVALAVGGPRLCAATHWVILVSWFFLIPYYIMAATHALASAFPQAQFSYHTLSSCIAAFLLLPLQFRTLHAVRLLALLSNLSVVGMLGLLLFSLGQQGINPQANPRSISLPALDEDSTGSNFLNVFGNLGTVVLVYQGQSIFMEMMQEMKEPSSFPLSLYLASGAMLVVYSVTGCVCYFLMGDEVRRNPLPIYVKCITLHTYTHANTCIHKYVFTSRFGCFSRRPIFYLTHIYT